ncbi:hypothetical protein LINPERHAP2_LOCUS39572 [Linum perenne]
MEPASARSKPTNSIQLSQTPYFVHTKPFPLFNFDFEQESWRLDGHRRRAHRLGNFQRVEEEDGRITIRSLHFSKSQMTRRLRKPVNLSFPSDSSHGTDFQVNRLDL